MRLPGLRAALCAAVIGLALVVSTAGSRSRPPAGPSWAAEAAPAPGAVRYTEQSIDLTPDVAKARARTVLVWRPNVPDSARLPVLYFLHGVPGQAADIASTGFASTLLAQATAGRPFVLVAPDGWGDNHDDTEWADAADGSDMVESFLIDQVVPTVEGVHLRDAGHRAIAGFSMGGYGAANIAMRHPDLFGTVVSVDGYFHIDDPSAMFAKNPAVERANDPSANVGRARTLRIMLLEDMDDPLPVVRGQAAWFGGLLTAQRIPATVVITPGSHSWGYVVSMADRIDRFVEDSWQP